MQKYRLMALFIILFGFECFAHPHTQSSIKDDKNDQEILNSVTQMAQREFKKELEENIINKPLLGKKCQFLLQERAGKLRHKEKLLDLRVRNLNVMSELKKTQKALRRNLELNAKQITRNIELNDLKLKNMEINIIRQGCPNISLTQLN